MLPQKGCDSLGISCGTRHSQRSSFVEVTLRINQKDSHTTRWGVIDSVFATHQSSGSQSLTRAHHKRLSMRKAGCAGWCKCRSRAYGCSRLSHVLQEGLSSSFEAGHGRGSITENDDVCRPGSWPMCQKISDGIVHAMRHGFATADDL